MASKAKDQRSGTLVIVGGHESKDEDSPILNQIAELVGEGKLLVVTSASNVQDEVYEDYRQAFGEDRGLKIEHVNVEARAEALKTDFGEILEGATGVFFSGGDQLRLISRLEGTDFMDGVRRIFEEGGVIAGTSAGASAMSETMLVSGPQEDSPRAGQGLRMAPGLGLFKDAIIDQHFAQRGRIGRLLAAVANNPRLFGIGIDENTAIVVRDRELRVIGAGGVYIADGKTSTFSNLSEQDHGAVVSLFDMRLHLLGAGDTFDIETRTPEHGEPEEGERCDPEES